MTTLKSAIVMMDDVFNRICQFATVLQAMNDLARAMRRWTEKSVVRCLRCRHLLLSISQAIWATVNKCGPSTILQFIHLLQICHCEKTGWAKNKLICKISAPTWTTSEIPPATGERLRQGSVGVSGSPLFVSRDGSRHHC